MKTKAIIPAIITISVIGISTLIFLRQRQTPLDPPITSHNQEEGNIMRTTLTLKVIINGEEYAMALLDNPTAQAFAAILPQKFTMSDLNGNEKYFYLDRTLPSNDTRPGEIQTGDVMLYDDRCLVIFYQTFVTNYSYTRIGHIDNLPNLENGEIEVEFR